MPELSVVDMLGNALGKIVLSDKVFGIKPNVTVMHEVVVNYLAQQRQGNQSALTRSEVSGGGRKPWRQKGTGHARQGSTRAPQWTHGGIVFPPKPRSYRYKVNKKVKKLAMRSAFSSKCNDNNLLILDSINLENYSTKLINNMLNALNVQNKALIVLDTLNDKVIKSSRNIPGVRTSQVNNLNVYDIINSGKLIILKNAIAKIEEVYA